MIGRILIPPEYDLSSLRPIQFDGFLNSMCELLSALQPSPEILNANVPEILDGDTHVGWMEGSSKEET